MSGLTGLPLMVWQAEVAHQMALVPLAFLVVLRARGERRDVAYWWLAGAFFVSWLSDTAADLLAIGDRWIPSLVYPVAQTVLVAAVLLARRQAMAILGVLVLAGCVAAFWRGVEGPDMTLRTVAWLAIVGIVVARVELPERLRICLIVYFGLGWVAWLVHARLLIVPTWYAYQSIRLAGLLLFCWAARSPGPRLRSLKVLATP